MVKKTSKKGFGVCKLTGQNGKFIDSHLLPKALTKPEKPGLPFVESGRGQRPKKRWSSWHDPELVTQAGESILADLDTWAIPELRRLKLVWSGWGPMQNLGAEHEIWNSFGHGIRKVTSKDSAKLRLFFLSLLWRAAATARQEFDEISISASDLQKLGQMLVKQDPDPHHFFPISLTQLSSMGIAHNLGPIRQDMSVPALVEGGEMKVVPIFRFYLEGLIIHIPTDPQDPEEVRGKGNLIVGSEADFIISTVPFENSFQLANIINIWGDSVRAGFGQF